MTFLHITRGSDLHFSVTDKYVSFFDMTFHSLRNLKPCKLIFDSHEIWTNQDIPSDNKSVIFILQTQRL